MRTQYPIIDGPQQHYVRMPIEVTKEIALFYKPTLELPVGSFIAVNVDHNGHLLLKSPVGSTYEICKRACDTHNKYHGFDENEVFQIIDRSKAF